ncbi:MAG TPA: hypothetical protein VLZ03_13425, partial [Thermodesulfobacteriota bacterium]|nr:hypothetical protein [Thermodesulfobacteriota bacterium]
MREEPESTEEASLVSSSMAGPVPGWIDPEGASIGQTLQMTTVINDGSPIEKETERAKEASMAFSSTADPFPTWFGPGEALKDQSLQTISTFIDGLPKGKWTEPGKEASVVFSSVVQPFRTRIDPSGASVDQTLGSLSGLGLGQRNDGGSALSFSTHKGLLHPEALTSNMGSSFILPVQNLSSTKGFDGKEPFSLPENTDPKGDEDSRNINPTESAAGTSRERVSSLGREGIRPEIRTVLQSEQGPLGPEKGKIDSLLDAERLEGDPSAKSTIPEDKGSYDRLSAELKAASTP